MVEPLYRCAECGLAVIVIGEHVIRGCKHEDATVVAQVTATVRAHGGLQQAAEEDHAGPEQR